MSKVVHISLSLFFGIFVLAAIVITVLGYVHPEGTEWTGVAGKTFWHWLDLLFAPVLLSGGGFLLYTLWTSSEHRLAEKSANEAARNADLDAIAKGYIDDIEQLLIKATDQDKAQSAPLSNAASIIEKVARARTLNVLEGLDQKRRGSIIRFLYETSLLEENPKHFFISLKGVTLHGAQLRGATLCKADLSETILDEADLSRTNLTGASLRNTNLIGADLRDANLHEADLSGANLTNVKGVTDEQLATCKSLKGATMPYGQRYEDILTTPGGQVWFNTYMKGSGEDGENSSSSQRPLGRTSEKDEKAKFAEA